MDQKERKRGFVWLGLNQIQKHSYRLVWMVAAIVVMVAAVLTFSRIKEKNNQSNVTHKVSNTSVKPQNSTEEPRTQINTSENYHLDEKFNQISKTRTKLNYQANKQDGVAGKNKNTYELHQVTNNTNHPTDINSLNTEKTNVSYGLQMYSKNALSIYTYNWSEPDALANIETQKSLKKSISRYQFLWVGANLGQNLSQFSYTQNSRFQNAGNYFHDKFSSLAGTGDKVVQSTQASLNAQWESEKFIFTAGLGYNTWNNKLDYQYSIRKAFVDQSTGIQPDAYGNYPILSYFSSDIQVKLLGTRKMSNLQVPISVAYKLNLGPKWILTPSLGLGYNYLVAAKGQFIAPNLERLANLELNQMNRHYLNSNANLGFIYNVSKTVRFNTQLGYNYSFTNALGNGSSLRMNPNTFTLQTGLAWKITK